MTIFSTPRVQREDMGVHEFSTGLSDVIGASASEAVHEMPTRQLGDMAELAAARGDFEKAPFSDSLGAGLDPVGAAAIRQRQPETIPRIAMTEAKAKVKDAGLDKALTLPDGEDISSPALDIMMERARGRQERAATIARGPSGIIPTALSVGTSFAVGALDPVNIAAAFIPVVGEARYGKMLADAAGTLPATVGERLAARAGIGAASGAVGMAAIEPIAAYAKTQEGQDYTFAHALRSVIFGAFLGSALHTGGGAIADALRSRAGRPLYPFDIGEPLEFHTPWEELKLPPAGAPHLPATAPEGEPLGRPPASQTEQAAAPVSPEGDLAAPEALPQPTPSPVVAVIDDLPPRAREDAMRGAVAALVQGEPVRVGEMIEAGAKADPRIAESVEVGRRQAIEAWHGSPHDFDRFDMSKIGTGEGAQSYGHGLYFAEQPKVATNYSKSTAYADFIRKVKELYSEHESPDEARRLLAESKDFTPGQKRLLAALEKDDWFGFDYPHQAVAAAVREAHNFDPSPETLAAIESLGNIYRVHINANREHFLDFDKPLSEQSGHVRGAIARLSENDRGLIEAYAPPNPTGEQLYSALGKNEALTSEALREVGIPGIKYFDKGSRASLAAKHPDAEVDLRHEGGMWNVYVDGALENAFNTKAEAENFAHGTRNLVLFDDKHVEITHKNGEAVSRGERQELIREKQNNAAGADVLEGPRAARGPRARDPESWSLLEFIASRGGLRNDDPLIGDVRGAIGRDNRAVPGFGSLIRQPTELSTAARMGGRHAPMTLDQAREAAIEAGYLRDNGADAGRESTTDVRTLLDAIDRELRGQKVYREGHERAERVDADQEAHYAEQHAQAVTELRDRFTTEGIDPKTVPDATLARVLEIMRREGESDPLNAYERALMEEGHDASEAGQHQRTPDHIPGWDTVSHDAGPAPDRGGELPRRGQTVDGDPARAAGGGDRAAAERDTWSRLADTPRDFNEPDVVAASKRAEQLPEPESLQPSKRLAAAQKAEAEAQAAYEAAIDYLPADLRNTVEQELRRIDQDALDTSEVLRRGAACLAAGVAEAVA